MPEVKQVTVYSVTELSDKAKDKAFYKWCSLAMYDGSDNIGTIESFCKVFNVKLVDWQVCEYRYGYNVEIPQQRGITKRKAFSMVNLLEHNQGYFLAGIACESIKSGWYRGDARYAIRNCLDDMFKAYQDDFEYYYSMESFIDMCEANDWQFLVNGDLFHE